MFLIGYLITYLLYTGFAAGVTSLLAVQGHGTHLKFADVVIMKLKLVTQSDGTHFIYLKVCGLLNFFGLRHFLVFCKLYWFLQDSPDPFAKSLYDNLMDLLEKNKVENLNEMFEKLEGENFIGLGELRNF